MLTDPDGMLDDNIYKNKKGEEVARIPNNLPNRVYNVAPDGQGGWVVQNEPPNLPGTSVPGVEVTEKRGEPLNTYERLMRNPVIAARNQHHPIQSFMWAAVTFPAAEILGGFMQGKYLFNAAKLSRYESATETGANVVYHSVENGVTRYVGITNNLARRAAEHLAKKGINIEPLMQGLSRADARAVEQALIEVNGLIKNGGTLLNKINSISPANPIYGTQLQRGFELLKSIGY